MNLRPVIFAFAVPAALCAQAPGHFPPDSLINVKVIPKNTPVMNVVGIMRNFAGALGVRCQFCHVGQEGMPLGQFDFAKDEKRTNAENLSGTAIEGGSSRPVAKGDFIIVPEKTPHWFSAINGTIVLMSLHLPRPAR